jgi:branched-chain amino acid aminotransferase
MTTGATTDFARLPHPSPLPAGERERLLATPSFGRVFSDHMVTILHDEKRGWHDARIEPRAAFSFDPAIMVLHYAIEIFEGLKAYRFPDGGGALFRPDANARRFRSSAERLAMPPLPEETFVESVRELVRTDRDWIPSSEGSTLYIRPFMFATEVGLGTRPAVEYRYCVTASPSGAYFSSSSGIRIWIADEFTRAGPGGTGAVKCGGNYAASLAAQLEGQREGCEQAVFLDAVERRWIEELGGMNIFFVFDDGSLQTPPLGTILPGITRDSLITLARDLGLTVREEPYSVDQWQDDARSGRLTETFACGTAAVVAAIGSVKGRRHDFVIGDGETGPVAARLRKALTDIQFGRAEDRFGWVDRLF